MPHFMPHFMQGPAVIDNKRTRAGSTRRFGVELEVSTANDYNALEGKTAFGLKGDCSVNHHGCEFVSPILQGDDGLAAVEALCDYAKAHNWECDDSCGYHLHIDMNGLDDVAKKRILYAYARTEALWEKFVQRRRAQNTYCRRLPVPASDIRNSSFDSSCREIENEVGRYCWCNTCAYYDHGTLEIRLHHGTVTKSVVINWIIAHLRFVEAVRSLTLDQIDRMFGGTETEAMTALERVFGSPGVVEHFRNRVTFHSRRATAAA